MKRPEAVKDNDSWTHPLQIAVDGIQDLIKAVFGEHRSDVFVDDSAFRDCPAVEKLEMLSKTQDVIQRLRDCREV